MPNWKIHPIPCDAWRKWIQKAALPTDTLKNIQRAKAVVLDEVQTNGTYTLNQVRAKAPDLNPAAFISAALLLKKEGKMPR